MHTKCYQLSMSQSNDDCWSVFRLHDKLSLFQLDLDDNVTAFHSFPLGDI